MQIPLSRFEQLIDPVILKRGLYYFLENQVEAPELIAPGKLCAVVHGTEDYEVTLLVKDDEITDFVCDCPYDLGPVCKHVVAVIYFLLQDKLDLIPAENTDKPGKRGRPRKAAGTDSNKDEANSIPEVRSVRRGRPKSIIVTHPNAVNKSVSRTSAKTTKQERDQYAKQIKAILKSAGGRSKFIDWNHVGEVGKAVYQMLQKAEQDIAHGMYRNAFLISSAVLEEMTRALDFADDSDGDIGGNIEVAMTMLHQLSELSLDDSLRQEMYQYALGKFTRREFEGWDWHLGMADLAYDTFQGRDEAVALMKALETTPFSQYEEEDIQFRRMILMEVIYGKEEADRFLRQHLHYRSFRILAMENAFAEGRLDQVKKMAKEGIELNREKAPGWLSGWYDWLIKIAIHEEDTAHIIEYALIQLLERNTTPQPYFELLKKYTPSESWEEQVEYLIREMSKPDRRWRSDFLPDMLVREELWDRLLHYLQDDARQWGVNLSQLNLYAPHLTKRFPDAFADLYESGIRTEIHHANARKKYQQICRDLRQMKKLGFIERVGEIVKSLKAQYPQRTALEEELGKV